MRIALVSLGLIFALTRSVHCEVNEKLFGAWKIVSALVEDVETKAQHPLYGEHPRGYLILLPTGRMMSLLVSEGRKPPRTDEERSAAYRSMVSYTGKYTIEGNKWTTKPDVAWNEDWMMEQIRYYRLDGDRLIVETAPAMNPNFGKVVRVTLTWQKEQ